MSYMQSESYSTVTPFLGGSASTGQPLPAETKKRSGAQVLVVGAVEAVICLGIAALPLAWIASAFLPTVAH